ncbi:MAG: hypothetical protein LAT68_09620 [Cyclobacteriaceae bacterium]|nr:hypothetical protein [Cyclobacteriaceae bacterium]MCH8516573.1 hypothetical protein [Cyclobacteriaceae bacterium]
MELIAEILKIILPALAVLYGMYLLVKSYIEKDLNQALLKLKTERQSTVLPAKLQAYERIVLLLERISINQLILRLNDSALSKEQLHASLVHEIREEFGHNLSQQVYLSNEAWELVKKAVEDLITLINRAAEETPAEERSIVLAKKIFELAMSQERDSVTEALLYLKEEFRENF